MSSLTDTDLRGLASALQQRRRALLDELTAREGTLGRVSHAHELLQQDGDDASARDADRAVDQALGEQERHELAELDAARQRLAQGRYGQCADCGEAIALSRLQAQPQALRCIGCESRREARSGPPVRHTL